MLLPCYTSNTEASSFWERWRKGKNIKNKDVVEKNLIALNDVFADIFNVLVFGGNPVVDSDSLEDMAGVSQYKADDARLHEQERDIYKLWKGQGVNFVIAGVENQTKPDRDMPFRCIGYDGASYRSQLLKKTEKTVKGNKKLVPARERYPVVTIVLYFGEKEWRYPLELKNNFRPKLPNSEPMKMLQPYITDYKVNLFDIPRLSPETVKQFKSDFRIVADYFVNAYNNPDYVPESAVITHVDEFLKLMRVLTGDNRYETISFTEQEKKEGVRMCKVLDAREARGEARGIKQGIKQGALQMLELVRVLSEQGYKTEEILAMTEKEDAREKLCKQYGI